MSSIAIRAESLGKTYRLGQRQPYRLLREALSEAVAGSFRRLTSIGRGAPLPDHMLHMTAKEHIWALQNVTFEVKHGEAVGIIGRNGAGKSTLLKILSRITRPTTGYASIRGRVGSLLEVGTGFHPELTGRENIFLSGAILGMRKADIQRRFDEIVAFAEIEKFLDTPVKHYSSGMYMRLAFAVAAHLEPEILIVDEVLAVGDVAFQKKCLDKMDDVTRIGRTVLFVSHNMEVLQRLCSRSVLLEQGQLIAQGDSSDVIAAYLSNYCQQARPNETTDLSTALRIGSGQARFSAVRYTSDNPAVGFRPYANGPLEFILTIDSDATRSVGSLAVFLSSRLGTKLVNADTVTLGQLLRLQKGTNVIKFTIEALHLNPGVYRVGLWLADPISSRANSPYDYIETAFEIEVVKPETETTGFSPHGFVTCRFDVAEVCNS